MLDRDGKCFYLLKYFLGGRMAGLREEWSNLRDNSCPSALSLTPVYDEVFSRLLKIRDLISFKTIYLSLLTEHSSSPVLPYVWQKIFGKRSLAKDSRRFDREL